MTLWLLEAALLVVALLLVALRFWIQRHIDAVLKDERKDDDGRNS